MGPATYVDIDLKQVTAILGDDETVQLYLDPSNDLLQSFGLFDLRTFSMGEPLIVPDCMSEYQRLLAEPQDQLSSTEQPVIPLTLGGSENEKEIFFNPPDVLAHSGDSGNSIEQRIFNGKTIPIPTASSVPVEDGIVRQNPSPPARIPKI